jgi:putative dimethyl sulfoxide reductase chaperone
MTKDNHTMENRQQDDRLEQQMALGLAYRFLGTAFYKPPESNTLENLIRDDLFADWIVTPFNAHTEAGLDLLRAVLSSGDAEALLPAFRKDFDALFIGPGKLLAPPWESVYRSHEHIIFEKQTLQVRGYYAKFGLQVPNLHREPDDHIGLELLFLSHLCGLVVTGLEEGAEDDAAAIIQAQRDFLRDHVLQWAGQFAQKIIANARTDYYRGLAHLLVGTLQTAAEQLEIPGLVLEEQDESI